MFAGQGSASRLRSSDLGYAWDGFSACLFQQKFHFRNPRLEPFDVAISHLFQKKTLQGIEARRTHSFEITRFYIWVRMKKRKNEWIVAHFESSLVSAGEIRRHTTVAASVVGSSTDA